jgi:hypothetical protein
MGQFACAPGPGVAKRALTEGAGQDVGSGLRWQAKAGLSEVGQGGLCEKKEKRRKATFGIWAATFGISNQRHFQIQTKI